jgi:hypothetical protein
MRLPLTVIVPDTGVPDVPPRLLKTHVTTTVLPDGIENALVPAAWVVTPPIVAPTVPAAAAPMLHAESEPEAVPEFDMCKTHEVVVAPITQVGVAPTDTFAVAPRDENNPKANPAMATPATRVIAMRMTVARTGEIAFLFAYLHMFNVG